MKCLLVALALVACTKPTPVEPLAGRARPEAPVAAATDVLAQQLTP